MGFPFASDAFMMFSKINLSMISYEYLYKYSITAVMSFLEQINCSSSYGGIICNDFFLSFFVFSKIFCSPYFFDFLTYYNLSN